MTIRIAIINGTGDWDDTSYKASMSASFCRRLYDQVTSQGAKDGMTMKAFYHRGPDLSGVEVIYEAWAAAGWLARERLRDQDARLMLAGYSRGGSAVIKAAEILDDMHISVDSMFLFDPVARHPYEGGEVIPANVAFSRTARRSQEVAFVLKYEGTIKTLGMDVANPCRPSFGNTGVGWRGSGDHRPAHVFKGSHGALGGCGWGFVTEDEACQHAVSAWMGQKMLSRGLNVSLGPGSIDRKSVAEKPATLTRLGQDAVDLGMMGKSALNRYWNGGRQ